MWVLLALLAVTTGQRPEVTIGDGPIVGFTMATWMGRNISAFRGIPFAAPPVGPLRFRDPQPVQPWTTPLDAGLLPARCPQIIPGSPQLSSLDEDCLYLNVYTPQLPSESANASLPVLVYFHGGAFTALSGVDYGPRYLLDHNIVFVTLNYRLGALGFLSTQNSVVPGNMGLKDQVAALRWIQSNIRAFGGNPDNVTIGGTSAGGASVQYHFLSRMSRGLFKRGICMSGSSLMPSAYQKAPLFKFYFLANYTGCSANDTSGIIECLRNVAVEEILTAQSMLSDVFYATPPMAFGPVAERLSNNPFITRYPYQVLRTGDIQEGSILFSVVTQEGLFPTAAFLGNSTGIQELNRNFAEYAPAILDYGYTVTHAEMNATSEAIREFYFGSNEITSALNQSIIRMAGDRGITDDVETAARIQSYTQQAPIYFYQLGYRGQYSLISIILSGTNTNWGVGHADDVIYVFNTTYIPYAENTASDRAMISIMSSLWANFAINGYPSVGEGIEWPPLDPSAAMSGPINYMAIHSPTSLAANSTMAFGNPNFWNNLPINEPMSGRPARDFL